MTEFLSDPQFWWKWVSIVLIHLVLAGDNTLVIFGLLLSLPLVVWGSGVLARLMNQFPLIIWGGGGVLGWVGLKMILDDPAASRWLSGSFDCDAAPDRSLAGGRNCRGAGLVVCVRHGACERRERTRLT